jgi:hypothetical protein
MPHLQHLRQQLLERYLHLKGIDSDVAIDDVKAITAAAYTGRMDTLFLAEGPRVWGVFDYTSGQVTKIEEKNEPGVEDLMDIAAVHTFLHSGRVYTLPKELMPSSQPMAAIVRY